MIHKQTDIRPSWIDLPTEENLRKIRGLKLEKRMLEKLRKYHALQKDSPDTLKQRRQKLKELGQYFARRAMLENNEMFSDFADIALKKAEYLNQLQYLYKNGFLNGKKEVYDISKLEPIIGTSRFQNPNYTALVLNNKQHYDAQNGHLWGEFWLEAIDPCHRQLEDYKDRWENSKTSTPFFLWLETQALPSSYKFIEYLQGDALKRTKLNIKDGKLFETKNDGSLEPLNTDDSIETVFVVTEKENIHFIEATSTHRHISLSQSKPIIAAGSFKVKDGKVTELFTNSGHYLPNKSYTLQMLKFFKNKELNITGDTVLKYFENDKVVESTVSKFMKLSLHKPKPPNPR